MAGFLFRLETVDGAPADPPTLSAAVPNWSIGDTIPLGRRTLRVIGKRDDDAEQPPVLAVEGMAGQANSELALGISVPKVPRSR
jgi:hypothetical protein